LHAREAIVAVMVVVMMMTMNERVDQRSNGHTMTYN
jgi:hypothetical protein